jgi:protein NEDD1
LSLSNDTTLLSSTSAAAAHVHNLSLGSHTVLKGLPLVGQSISTSAFRPQLRTRLMLGIGKQLVVYDTARLSGPINTIGLSQTNSGDITAVACSPFSKTLVAVATTGGTVGLVDLEKEKG